MLPLNATTGKELLIKWMVTMSCLQCTHLQAQSAFNHLSTSGALRTQEILWYLKTAQEVPSRHELERLLPGGRGAVSFRVSLH